MTHRECRNLFVEALYEECGETLRREFDNHLAGCPECRASFEELRDVASIMKNRRRDELSKTDWIIFWNELSGAIRQENSSQGQPIDSVKARLVRFVRFRPALGFSAAALGILFVGILIGKLMLTTPLTTDQLADRLSEAERTVLNERTQNYLQRSKILLLGIVNGNGVTPSSYDMTKQQEVSRILVKEAGELRSELTEGDQQQMRRLIGDLEVILMQIANLEQHKDFPGLEIIRDGVDRKGLLLKINLEQMNAQRETAPAPKKSSRSSSSSI